MTPILTTAALVLTFMVVMFGPTYMIRRKRRRTDKELSEGTRGLSKTERTEYLNDWMARDAHKTMRFVNRMDIVTMVILAVAAILVLIMFLGPLATPG